MWDSVSVSAVIGIAALILLAIPVQGYLTKLSSKLRSTTAKLTDRRVQMMSELIAGIQVRNSCHFSYFLLPEMNEKKSSLYIQEHFSLFAMEQTFSIGQFRILLRCNYFFIFSECRILKQVSY